MVRAGPRSWSLPAGVLLWLGVGLALARLVSVIVEAVWWTYGDFAATLPGAYAERLNPTLWNSPDLAQSWAFHKHTYLHGPTQFLTLYPIVFLDSYASIARLLLVVYVVVLLGAVAVMWRCFTTVADRRATAVAVVTSTLLYTPALQALVQREFEIVILLALSLALWAAVTDRRLAHGALLAYVAGFKYLPLLFVPYLAARRWWRALAGFAAVALVIVVLAEMLFGLPLFFNNNVPDHARTQLAGLKSRGCYNWGPGSETLTGIRWGLCSLRAGGVPIPLPWTYLAILGLTIGLGGLGFARLQRVGRLSPDAERWRRIWEFSLCVIAYSTFFFSHYYYLTVLILPLNALLVRYTLSGPWRRGALAALALAYVLLAAFVLPSQFLSWMLGMHFWAAYMRRALYLFGELLLLALVLREYLRLAREVGASAGSRP